MAGMMPRPIPPGTVEIDDSRLRDMWTRHHQRSLFTARAVRWIGVAAVLGIAAVLAAIALAFWALERKPPVVNVEPAEVHVAPAEVHVTVPPGPPAVVNVYPTIKVPPPAPPAPVLPQVPPPAPAPGPENKVVTEFTVFQTVTVDGNTVQTGWNYHNSNDTTPYAEYCYVVLSPTRRLNLGKDHTLNADLAAEAADVGMNYTDAVRYFQSCQWSMI